MATGASVRSDLVISAYGLDRHEKCANEESSLLSQLTVLNDLAPLHRRYAVKRGMCALGLEGKPPTVDDLMLAMVRPTAPKMQLRRVLSGDGLITWAIDQFLGDPRFDDEDGNFCIARALAAASGIVGNEAQDRHRREHAKAMEQYHHAQALFAQWHDLAVWLAQFMSSLGDWVSESNLAAMPEKEIKRIAVQMASKQRSSISARRLLAKRAAAGDPLPDLTPTERRLMCPWWWRRRLRRRAAAARQMWSAALQTTGGRHGKAYADDYTMERWTERQDRARRFGESHAMVGRDGTTIPISTLIKRASVAALNRAYVMMLGIDDIAALEGLVPIFITITLPAEYHPNPAWGGCSWRPEFGPEQADADLKKLWQRFRARLANRGIRTLGMRVVEGHADGCPHLHSLLYVNTTDIDVVDGILQNIRPEPVPGDRIATRLVVIDRTLGRPTTYIMKTLFSAFNVRPTVAVRNRQVDADAQSQIAPLFDNEWSTLADHDDNFDRHRALASERGWRRFEMLGVHGIQRVWQTIFTLEFMPDDAPQHIRACHRAMREQRWGDAIRALNGIRGIRGAPRVRLAYDRRKGQYGEMHRVPTRIFDEHSGWSMPIRRQDWKIQRCPREKTHDTNLIQRSLGNEKSPPWGGEINNKCSILIIKTVVDNSAVDKFNKDIQYWLTVVYSYPSDGRLYCNLSEEIFITSGIFINYGRIFGQIGALRDP